MYKSLVMGTITNAACRRSRSSFTLGCSGIATRLAGKTATQKFVCYCPDDDNTEVE